LFVGASIAWNEEDRDTQELDEMQLVVDLLPTLMIEIKTIFSLEEEEAVVAGVENGV